MKRFLLDTSAILTLRDDEPGADRVAEVLGLADRVDAQLGHPAGQSRRVQDDTGDAGIAAAQSQQSYKPKTALAPVE